MEGRAKGRSRGRKVVREAGKEGRMLRKEEC